MSKAPPPLDVTLARLRAHEAALRQAGCRHLAVFGSVARGEATDSSKIDVLVDVNDEISTKLMKFGRIA